ncbi:ubiquitin carboxyl-terminal hydrolase 5 [Anaeramoeba flamelloides]|uniref:Ubiquitin carboxyl-terminal hydrolase 5 n=1 Tax=Anaeramoeba flamelloides TaxID=1746091 RepID=A0ABQ8XXB1_9EUKA|nr:ubiquitin carboxyl-terminal hydrolase 5 [Anaeramoeba flamelloides]
MNEVLYMIKINEVQPETSILENLDVHNLSPIEEKNLIKLFESQSSQLVQGAKWYLIDSVFYVKWRSYVGYDLKENEKNTSNSPKPDMIDNSALVNAKGKLKPGLSDYHHYNLVSELVWKALHKIYGGGPIIFRKVITCGIKKNMIVEIYPLNLKVHLEGKGKSVDITISKSETIEKIVQVACKEFKIKTEEVKLFDYYFLQIGKEYSIKTKQISDSYITNNNDLLLRTKESIENQKNNIDLESTDYLKTLINKPKHRGLTGLSNLGNTCFMNSGIQCLLNTIPLITYFLQGNYLTEINEKNPIGMGGKMANAFAEVCLEYWGGKSSVYSPREFKHVIGQFANQFTGYNQHDVQELISFVLDGIHEDLNRIKDKPYLENPETENKTDIQIGKEYWWNFKARNNSIITDLFHGQLRSKLTCPKCKKSTTKFDPFSSLSLPIPPPKEIELKITVIYKNGKLKPQVFGVKVERSLGIQGLYIELSKLTSIDPNNFLIGEVYNHKIYQKYGKTKDLGKIKQNDTIIAWEIDNDQNKEKLNNNNKKKTYHIEVRFKNIPLYRKGVHSLVSFGVPRIVSISGEQIEYKELYQKICLLIDRVIPNNLPTEEDDQEEIQSRNKKREKIKKDKELRKQKKEQEKKEKEKEKEKGIEKETNNQTKNEKENHKEQGKKEMETETEKEREKEKEKEVDNQTGNGNDIETEKENDNESYSFISETDDYSDYYNEEDYSNSYGSSDYEIYGGGEANWETESESDYDNLESSDIDDMIYSKHGFYKYVFRPFFKITKINRLYSFGNVLKEDETVNVDEWDSFEVTFNPNLQKDDEIKEEKVINHTEQLAVANLHQSYKQMAKNLSKKIEQLDILKCLEKFLSEEILSEKDKWYCSKCKEQVQAIKKFDLWKLPEVLIIHLKRISYGTIFREKIDTLINFPEILNLEQYKINKKSNSKPSNLDYQLYAVSNHYGYYGGGHYTAYAQNPSTQDWYEYDDSTVSSIDSVKNSITRNAYLLFYHRKNEYAKYIKALPEEIEDFKNN